MTHNAIIKYLPTLAAFDFSRPSLESLSIISGPKTNGIWMKQNGKLVALRCMDVKLRSRYRLINLTDTMQLSILKTTLNGIQ